MGVRRVFCCLFLLGFSAGSLVAVGVEPSVVHLPAKSYAVADVLSAIEKQTGNRIVDRRTTRTPETFDIGFEGQTFWQALDLIAAKLDARIFPYGDGGVQLLDGPFRSHNLNVGVCRLEVKSVAVQRDFQTERQTCVLDIECAWEPRFEPLYLTVDAVKGAFAPMASGKALSFGPTRGVAQSVAERRAQVIELRFPAPDRTSPAIALLSGELKFLGADRMLNVTFADLAGGKQVRFFKDAGVAVTLVQVGVGKKHWTFDLEIENPEMPPFESFQSWTANNRIHLERTKGGKKEIWTHNPSEESADVSGRRAKIRYSFTGAQNQGALSEWTLVYRTPSRIVETILPFTLRDVPLP